MTDLLNAPGRDCSCGACGSGPTYARGLIVSVTPDVRLFHRALRTVSRRTTDAHRNARTAPVSAERLDIQRLGRREMAAAIAWFHNHLEETRP